MKKYISILFVILIITACSDNFLDLTPSHRANVNDFYKNANDFETALIGAYGTLVGDQFADLLPQLFDLRSDNATALSNNGYGEDIADFTLNAKHGIVSSFYASSYRGIQACNAIIGRIENVSMAADVKNRIVGEAKFMRALRYFYLVNTFGDVPLILNETTGASLSETMDLERSPVTEIYTAIISDLKDAEQKLGGFSVPHRSSVPAAKALLGKVYLFQKDYTAAAAKLKEVISLNQFDLIPNYTDLFKIGNTKNKESIFAIQHIGGADGTGSGIAFNLAPRQSFLGSFKIINQNIYMDPNLNRAYSSSDVVRRDISALKYTDKYGADTVYLCKKYLDNSPFESFNASNTFYVIRYADVLLMYAEALNEVGYSANGEAFTYLNKVRQRAGIGTLTSAGIPDQASFKSAVLKERRLELAMEGHRWLDLVRSGTAIEVMSTYLNKTLDQHYLLYPIPEGEILNNPDKIKQNPGY